MFRSVVQLGNKTHMVSLPAGWMRRVGVKKGDPIDVEERGDSLIITPAGNQKGEKATIEISGLSGSIKRIIGALYKAGFDEIEVRFGTQEERKEVDEALKVSLRSLGIVAETSKSLTIKNLAEFRHEEFDTVLRRLFLLLLQNAEAKSHKVAPDEIQARDAEINDCADQCRRSLIRKGYERTTPALYCIVEQLEKMGDRIRDLNPVSKELETWTALFRTFYELFYSFDIKRFDSWLVKVREFKQQVAQSNHSQLGALAEDLFDLNGALLVCRLSA